MSRAHSFAWSVAALGAVVLAVPSAADDANVSAPSVVARQAGGVRWLEARWPGPVLAAVAVPDGRGGRELFVLATVGREADGPRAVDHLDTSGDTPHAERWRDGLAAGVDALDAIDLDGDGTMELVAGEPRRLERVGSLRREALPTPVLADPAWIDLRAPEASRLRAPEAARRLLATAEVGRVRFFAAGGGDLAPAAEVALPVEANRDERGLRLVSPPLRQVARRDASPLWFAGPLAAGASRLRLVRIDPAAANESRRSEVWCRLPGAEKVDTSAVLAIDGIATLAVLTSRADRLGVFEKAQLRVFPLSADRTRAGRSPSFVAETGISRWRRATLVARDLDGDGRDDLAILGPLGLRGEKLGVQLHAGLGDGRFAPKATRVEIDDGERQALVVDDLTRDARADLLLVDGARVAVHAGLAPGGAGPFAERPWRTFEMRQKKKGEQGEKVEVAVGGGGVRATSLAERPEVLAIDLDGDRRPEILVLSEEDGRGVIRLVRFD